MSAEPDVNRIVRSWLREEEHESADAIVGIVLSRLDTAPQRRSWWPSRRFAHLNTYARLGLGAAAVVVAAFVAINLLPSVISPGRPTSVPTVQPTAAPTATPVASPSTPPEVTKGDLAPGTYSFSDPTLTEVPFTFTVPAGWTFNEDSMIFRGSNWKLDGVALTTWRITHVYADACGDGALIPADTKKLVVPALAAQLGHETSALTEVTIGGLPATRFVFSFAPGFVEASCSGGPALLWPDPGADTNGGLPMFAGQTTVIYVLEGNGRAFALVHIENAMAPAAHVEELQQVYDSIEFQP